MAIHLHGLIHTEVLVVACQNLHRRTTAMVEENEVFKQIQQVLLLADATEHCWQFDIAVIQLCQSFPLMKELPLSTHRTHTAFHAIAKHDHGIVVEQMRYGVKVVAIVVGISILYVLVMILQFDEDDRQTIHEAHHISSALVDRSLYP